MNEKAEIERLAENQLKLWLKDGIDFVLLPLFFAAFSVARDEKSTFQELLNAVRAHLDKTITDPQMKSAFQTLNPRQERD